jgi:hypothetical protein
LRQRLVGYCSRVALAELALLEQLGQQRLEQQAQVLFRALLKVLALRPLGLRLFRLQQLLARLVLRLFLLPLPLVI